MTDHPSDWRSSAPAQSAGVTLSTCWLKIVAELIAIVDPAPQAQALAAGKSVPWYPDFATMMKRRQPPDGVIIATPYRMHVAHGLEAVDGWPAGADRVVDRRRRRGGDPPCGSRGKGRRRPAHRPSPPAQSAGPGCEIRHQPWAARAARWRCTRNLPVSISPMCILPSRGGGNKAPGRCY